MSEIPHYERKSRHRQRFYFAAWRWHFYAGLFVIPFMLILTLTGLVMMLGAETGNQLSVSNSVATGEKPLPVAVLADIARAQVPTGTLDQYVAPERPDRAAFFVVKQDDKNIVVAINPYTGVVPQIHDKNSTLYAIANDIHGELLLGDFGDRIIETAASLTILMIVTGLYMWWPRDRGLLRAIIPQLSRTGRNLWKELHVFGGVWVSVFLVLFCISGLAWAGIWGGKIVQPWSSFPAEKEAAYWSSDTTHASMNHGPHDDVPWGLEQTPMPVSGTTSGKPSIDEKVTLETVAAWAGSNGFEGQYKINLPRGATGVFTLSADASNEDSVRPSQDRTVHFDQYTGNILADIGYEDYSLMAKAMAQGIALHKGMAGTWNFILNLVLLATITLVYASGTIMWWKRRPKGVHILAAPPMPRDMPVWRSAVFIALVLALAFPMAGFAMLCALAADKLVVTRVSALRRILS